MNLPQALAQQFGFMYRVTAANLNGMTQQHSLEKASEGGNCANWILGHLTNVQNGVMELIGEKPVWRDDQLARAGFDPIQGQADAIDWETMREQFLGSRERCVAAVSALSDESLSGSVPNPFGGTCSRADLLTTLAFHQAYHAGQLALCRRAAGLDGVIKAPGQPKAQTV